MGGGGRDAIGDLPFSWTPSLNKGETTWFPLLCSRYRQINTQESWAWTQGPLDACRAGMVVGAAQRGENWCSG